LLVVDGFGEAASAASPLLTACRFGVDQGEILGLIGPQRLRQEHDLQHAVGHAAPDGRLDHVQRRGARGPGAATVSSMGGRRPAPSRFPRAVSHRASRFFENVGAGRLLTARAGTAARRRTRPPEKALAMVGLPTDRQASVDGLGARRPEKNSNWQRRSRPAPKTSARRREPRRGWMRPRWSRRLTCCAISATKLGITIIWGRATINGRF